MNNKYMIVPLPVLETKRLTLRQLERTDCDDVYRYASLSQTTRYLLWSPHLNLFETKGYLDYARKNYRTGDFFDWGIVYKQTEAVIGTVGFTTVDFQNNKAEIGYVLSPEYHHMGLASEAVERILRFAFDKVCFERLEAHIMEENIPSRKLAEKHGFTLDGIMKKYLFVKGEYKNICIYSLLREDFKDITV